MRLRVVEGDYAVCRLGPLADTPATPERGAGFWSLTEVGEERSLVCLEDLVPEAGAGSWATGATVVHGWRILEVLGPLDLGLTGVMAALAVPLAEAGVPIFPDRHARHRLGARAGRAARRGAGRAARRGPRRARRPALA
jgi:uncharacterized protein